MQKLYGIYDERHLDDVIYLACGNGCYKSAIYADVDEAIKICNVCNAAQPTSPITIKCKYVVAEFNLIPSRIVSIINLFGGRK